MKKNNTYSPDSREKHAIADPFESLMLTIKGGTFDMGDVMGEGYLWESPVHHVAIPDFLLCKYVVSQRQWMLIMGSNPSSHTGDDNLPVEQVSWDDIQMFIRRLNALTGRLYRLPSESEWEYAAREGGKNLRFGNGKNIADPEDMNFNCSKEKKQPYSIVGDYRRETVPVGSFAPNVLGLYNMSGNVWELCEDVWHDDYTDAPADGSPWLSGGDPTRRVGRGGSWNLNSEFCRVSARSRTYHEYGNHFIGFRLAL